MNVLMLLSNPFTHDPRVYNEARSLVKAGHKVTVLCWDRASAHKAEEVIDDVAVVRTRNTGYMKMLPYDIFRMRPWWRQVYHMALGIHSKEPFQVVHCHDFDTLPAGVWLKKRLGIRLVYDAHEIWGHMVARDLPGWWANHYLKRERKLAPEADHIITVAEPHEKHFRKMGCKNVTLVRNCKPLSGAEYESPSNDVFTLTYIGGLNSSRFLLEAMDVCSKVENIKFIIAGFGGMEEDIKNQAKALSNVEFKGKIPMSDVIPLTKEADAVHCLFDPSNKNNQVGPPNKIFEAMAVGRPVIATRGIYSGELVKKFNMGLAIDFDKKAYRKALVQLRDNPSERERMGRNALEAAKGEFNWPVQEARLLGIYNQWGASNAR